MPSKLTYLHFVLLPMIILSCGKSNIKSTSQNPALKPSQEHCQEFPRSIVCKDQGPSDQTLPDLETQLGCQSSEHSYGKLSLGGHCKNGSDVPITFVFLSSSDKDLSYNIGIDSERTIQELNKAYQHNHHQYIQFSLKRSIQVIDDFYHNTNCNQLQEISEKYGSDDSLVMVFVNDLEGSCAGVSWIWTFPDSHYSVTMVEYRYPFQIKNFTPVIHEFAHTMGLHHTSQTTPNSTPGTGLKTFNQWLSRGSRDSRRCSQDFSYFISQFEATNELVEDLEWNSYENTMYPSFGSKEDGGFFTQGYDYSMSWAFDCWYNLSL